VKKAVAFVFRIHTRPNFMLDTPLGKLEI